MKQTLKYGKARCERAGSCTMWSMEWCKDRPEREPQRQVVRAAVLWVSGR